MKATMRAFSTGLRYCHISTMLGDMNQRKLPSNTGGGTRLRRISSGRIRFRLKSSPSLAAVHTIGSVPLHLSPINKRKERIDKKERTGCQIARQYLSDCATVPVRLRDSH